MLRAEFSWRVWVVLFLAGFVAGGAAAEPVVANAGAAQRGDGSGMVDIFYDVSGGIEPMTVSVVLSNDAGATWTFTPKMTEMTGDVGAGVTNGTGKHIVWNALADKPGIHWPNARAKVTATDAEVHTPGEEATFAGIQFVWIPAGTFMMGRYSGEQDSYEDEDPQHPVTIAQGFWMGKYEVTQAQWQAVMGSNPSNFTGDTSRPVETVSWDDITQTNGFLDKLNQANPGMTFRLPTEAEWEYACRAGTTTRFYWGNDPSYTQIGTYAWYNGNSSSATHPVGQKTPNAWGLYDMSGNVWEWCQDWFGAYAAGAVSDPQGASSGSYRVLRGSAWDYSSTYCRAAARNRNAPDYRSYTYGLRVVRTP